VSVQDRQIQLELARKVLVENGFAYPGAFGDLIHTGGVVATVDENVAGGDEQLTPTLVTRQSVAAPSRSGGFRPTPSGGVGELAHPFLNLLVIAPVWPVRG
jgi:hypothetical protein